ncbi:MAG: ABC-type lipoprotein export system ATPase subunit [Phenylobacterium sp.]|jgi:ABC-type lipoprotein export system ATPase subunit
MAEQKQQQPISNEIPFIQKVVIKSLFGKKDIDWTLGDVNVLVGKNGSGKSTILRAIYGMLCQEHTSQADFEHLEEMDVRLANGVSAHLISDSKGPGSLEALLNQWEKLSKADNMEIKLTIFDKVVEITKRGQISDITLQITDHNDELIKDNKDLDEILQKVHIEYLSTFDMMLLTKKEQDEISKEVFTQLDAELTKETAKLTEYQLELNNLAFKQYNDEANAKEFITIRNESFSRINKFEQALNTMFNPNDKQFKISDKGKVEVYYGEDQIPLTALSSGEKQLILILLRVVNTSDKPTILLLDEPEISLHLHWQENLINIIRSINEQCQLIIVTHSPALVMNGWMDSYIDMKDISTDSQ